ncbi:MAG: ABC transporter permease [Ardenticatenaceae bacterium]|nr:ABC transporter permease [Anaerolineales bacterium]MCB8973784.1 ABC transporter permease [Ardenticatenaceae bacterium]
MNSIIPILKKEFREIWRDPYTLGMAIILPLMLLFLFGYALNLDVKDISLAVVDLDHSAESRAYLDVFVNTGKFNLDYRLSDPAEAERLLDQGKIQAAVLIPSGFSRALMSGETAQAQTLVDGTFPSSARVIQGYVEAINEVFSAKQLGNHFDALGANEGLLVPAVMNVSRVRYNPALKSANFVIPGLIGVILMAFPPLLSALAIVREKERGSIQQIFVSPLQSWAFIVGKLIPYVIISLAEWFIIFLVARYWFGVPMAGNGWLFFLVSIPYVLSTVSIGLLVSALVRTQLAAMLMVIAFTMMPAFIFSGFMYPIANMPEVIQTYSLSFPARYFISITHGVFLRGVGLNVWWKQLAALAVYTAVLVGLASLRFKKKVA